VGCVWVYMEKVELRYWLEHSDEKNMNKLIKNMKQTAVINIVRNRILLT